MLEVTRNNNKTENMKVYRTRQDVVDVLVQITRQLSKDDKGMSYKDAKAFVDAYIETITSNLENGDETRISRFGRFDMQLRATRPVRNPKTGEEMMLEPKLKPVFVSSGLFRDRCRKELK
ncbi:HU family DNA-binding protein [Photobacterium leiognathi]|uniref:HU family DNA-binding protein n=1 Tax=Photobacterium leiognathi TaxID=553611 RepID=UPI0029828712|nr:HU family DNA-binding protein [Photobacterium leiognathi]